MLNTAPDSNTDNFHDFSPAGVASVDINGVFIEVNRKFAELFGYETHELDGQHLEVLLPFAMRERHKSLFGSMSLHGAGRTLNNSKPLTCLTKTGKTVYVLIGLRPVRRNLHSKNPDAWLVHVCDVTELVSSSEKLQATLTETLKQKEQIKAMLHQRELMLRVLSHELRTPLSVVTGFLESTIHAEQSALPARRVIANVGDRLAALSKVSQVWLGQTEPIHLSTDVPRKRILKQIQRIKDLHQVDSIILSIQLDETMDLEVQMDWDRLNSLLGRSLSIALRNNLFLDSGIQIQFKLTDIQSDNARFEFDLKIDQPPKAATSHDQNQLPIDIDQILIEALAEQLGGHSKIVMQNGLLESLHFDCRVAIQSKSELLEPTEKSWHDFRVLLVEDEAMIRKLETLQLNKWGAQVDSVADGQLALEHLQSSQEHYDLVLMDLHMPVKNGFDCTREIREKFPDRCTHIVALTAGGTAGDRAKAFDAGVDGFFLKPLKKENLANMISRQTA